MQEPLTAWLASATGRVVHVALIIITAIGSVAVAATTDTNDPVETNEQVEACVTAWFAAGTQPLLSVTVVDAPSGWTATAVTSTGISTITLNGLGRVVQARTGIDGPAIDFPAGGTFSGKQCRA